MEPHRSEVELVVLHGLRCIGFASENRVAVFGALDSGTTLGALRSLAGRGLVSHVDGPLGGWGLTDAGRQTASEWIACELDLTGARPRVEASYTEFLQLNASLLEVCHDWQMRKVGSSSIPNDHRDPAYDARVMDRLVVIDRSVGPILESLAASLRRFDTYRARLGAALARVEEGRHEYLTDRLDSYHVVWFQLHEDLLVTLGIDRFGGSTPSE